MTTLIIRDRVSGSYESVRFGELNERRRLRGDEKVESKKILNK